MGKSYNGKKLNKKKIMKLIIAIVLIILLTVIGILYENNNEVKMFLDKYVFLKEKHENNLPKIPITSANDINTYAYKGNILILDNNKLIAYNSNGNEEYSLDIEVSNPIFKSSGDYLCIGEKNGKKIYVISEKNIVWQKDLEGNICDITLNSNGYLAVAITGTLYKTIVQTFDNKGEEQFKNFLSFTYVIDMSISPDNKYLAIAEANFSGIMIQSNIIVISTEKKEKVYNKINEEGDLIVNIKYQSKDELTCVFDDHIEIIKDETSTIVSNFEKEETLFTGLNNKIIKIIQRDSQVYLKIMTNEHNAREYEILEPKKICVSDDVIAINLGSEVLFYNNSGWLIKKYSATHEINKIVLSNNLAGIVYNDKIEIVSL